MTQPRRPWTRIAALAAAIVILGGVCARRACGLYFLRGRPAPPLALPALDGRTVSLAALRGKVVLLDFWATWCGPCRAELPAVESVARRYADRGLVALAVNQAEPRADVEAFVRARPLALPVLLDDGRAGRAYAIEMLPSLVLIGRDGKVAQTVAGTIDEGDLAKLVEPLLPP